jgi:hypothetical protein
MAASRLSTRASAMKLVLSHLNFELSLWSSDEGVYRGDNVRFGSLAGKPFLPFKRIARRLSDAHAAFVIKAANDWKADKNGQTYKLSLVDLPRTRSPSRPQFCWAET